VRGTNHANFINEFPQLQIYVQLEKKRNNNKKTNKKTIQFYYFSNKV